MMIRPRTIPILFWLCIFVVLAGIVWFVAGCGHSVPPPPNQVQAPTLSWTEQNINVPPCTASITTNCKLSYTITDVTTGQHFSVAISALSYVPTETNLVAGSHTYSIEELGIGNDGAQIVSPIVTTTVILK